MPGETVPPPPNGQEHVLDPSFSMREAESWAPPKAAPIENEYDYLFRPNPEEDTLLASLTPQERARYDQEMIEKAARRTPNMWQILGEIGKDDYGVKVIPSEKITDFKESLNSLGFLTEAPTEEDVKEGIEHARKKVESGQAPNELESYGFMQEYERRALTRGVKKTVVSWDRDQAFFVDPMKIEGTGSFESWSGRSVAVGKSYDKDGQLVTGPSINAIESYATRDTQLPPLEYTALELILAEDGPHLYAAFGSHRTAAAKLRHEPLRFSSMVIYDSRLRTTQP